MDNLPFTLCTCDDKLLSHNKEELSGTGNKQEPLRETQRRGAPCPKSFMIQNSLSITQIKKVLFLVIKNDLGTTIYRVVGPRI